jgi:hypothetical protein
MNLEVEIAAIIRKHRDDPLPPQGYVYDQAEFRAAREILKLMEGVR